MLSKCHNCPHAYYVENGKGYSELVGCAGYSKQEGIVIKNNGEGITCMISDQGYIIYECDIVSCPLWH